MLLDHGHFHANRYPLARVSEEARIVRDRMNHVMASESLLLYACLGAVLNGKAGWENYDSIIKGLINGGQ